MLLDLDDLAILFCQGHIDLCKEVPYSAVTTESLVFDDVVVSRAELRPQGYNRNVAITLLEDVHQGVEDLLSVGQEKGLCSSCSSFVAWRCDGRWVCALEVEANCIWPALVV